MAEVKSFFETTCDECHKQVNEAKLKGDIFTEQRWIFFYRTFLKLWYTYHYNKEKRLNGTKKAKYNKNER